MADSPESHGSGYRNSKFLTQRAADFLGKGREVADRVCVHGQGIHPCTSTNPSERFREIKGKKR